MVQFFVAFAAGFVQLALLARVSAGFLIPCVVQTLHGMTSSIVIVPLLGLPPESQVLSKRKGRS